MADILPFAAQRHASAAHNSRRVLSQPATPENILYADIPVEATGAGVPEPVTQFTNPPLDPVLLENIGFAMYTTPTPVQKYSIPIVAGGRDLMACAQVSI